MPEKDYVVGVALRIVRADNTEKRGLAGPVLAAESPMLTVHDCEAEVLQDGASAIAYVYLAEIYHLLSAWCIVLEIGRIRKI